MENDIHKDLIAEEYPNYAGTGGEFEDVPRLFARAAHEASASEHTWLDVLTDAGTRGARMIPKDCKRLAEVDFRIAAVSKHSAREKYAGKGCQSILHLCWARRPLAACRAMLLGLLLPDPCDPSCPVEFKTRARKTLLDAPGWGTERNKQQLRSDEGLRESLLSFIGDVANWDVARHPRWIGAAGELVRAAHPDEPPLVVGAFSGGGSIPLEALRLGCEAFASDLNPVACLILRVMPRDIPRHGPELADELRGVGGEIKEQAEKKLSDVHPRDPDGSAPISYLWARTVRCETPNRGAEIPVCKSGSLAKRNVTKARYFRETENGGCLALMVEKNPIGGPVEPRLAKGEGGEDPRPGFVQLRGTKAPGNNANVICPCCGAVLPRETKTIRECLRGYRNNEAVRMLSLTARGVAPVERDCWPWCFEDPERRDGTTEWRPPVTARPYGKPGRDSPPFWRNGNIAHHRRPVPFQMNPPLRAEVPVRVEPSARGDTA